MKGVTICFSVNTQFENLGDALINRELISEAMKFGSVKVEVSRCPDSFIETLGLKRLDSNNKITLIRGFLSLLFVIITSRLRGDRVFYFLNPGGLGRPRNFRQRISAMIYNFLLLFYVCIGVKVCHVGISHEKSGLIDLLISKVRAKLTSYLYVRDKGSFNYLKSHNFRLAGVFPDLAFYLYGGENIHVRSISSDKHKACFSFRFDSENENSKENVKAFIMSVVNRGVESDSYVFISQVKRDDVHMVQLAEWFLSATGFKADVVLCSESIEDMMALYSGCHTVYSNRLHVLLLSGFSGAMPVAVIDMKLNKKVADLYQDIGIEGLIVDIHQSLTYVPVCDRELLDVCLQTQYLRLKQMFPEIISAETY